MIKSSSTPTKRIAKFSGDTAYSPSSTAAGMSHHGRAGCFRQNHSIRRSLRLTRQNKSKSHSHSLYPLVGAPKCRLFDKIQASWNCFSNL